MTCPALCGLVTRVRSLEEARGLARGAIGGYLELLREGGLPIPEGDEPAVEPIIIETVKVTLQPA